MDEKLTALARTTAEDLGRRRAGVAVAAVVGDRTGIATAGPPGDVFEIGSVTKVLTALILARMVVDGRAGLDEPVADLLGAPVPSRDGEPIRLRHLSTHTSGLPRLPKGKLREAVLHPYEADPYADCTAEAVLEGLARTRLRARPGRRVKYSNLGVGLLGLALATRAGTDYATLLRAEICDPLGLERTGVDVPGLRQGHRPRGQEVSPWNMAALAGAGGVRGTAADLARLVRAHLDPASTPLGPAIDLVLRTRRPGAAAWGHLGWFGTRRPAGPLLWHNGGTAGFTSFVGISPECGVGVVVLSDTRRMVDGGGLGLLTVLESR
ncbi:CubicO group peptidase (beta-lactamase class C family) [Actinocorallia herbida]|uniref:CubicO group peptidase (Beta-lactamase class C family) n=1 Tax=Actinocorallia herbida TaxID=58109 RepID=A0A3N1D556_9ACTN|nr:serine hydrolase [Actinocorallia herbida]ROO88672.1 CubicO group peptidase (beta-lactamase class C family) [Actinocorallia herbida]